MLIGLYAPQMNSGKSTVANILKDFHGFQINSFATPIKSMVLGIFYCLGYEDWITGEMVFGDSKETVIPELGVSTRYLMQTLGTEWGRNMIDQDIWIKILEDRLGKSSLGNYTLDFVIDDVRFENEAQWIKDSGGFLVKVLRPDAEELENSHASEGNLDNWKFDGIIINNGSVDELRVKVLNLIRELSSLYLLDAAVA